jgi:hypothetical protein
MAPPPSRLSVSSVALVRPMPAIAHNPPSSSLSPTRLGNAQRSVTLTSEPVSAIHAAAIGPITNSAPTAAVAARFT